MIVPRYLSWSITSSLTSCLFSSSCLSLILFDLKGCFLPLKILNSSCFLILAMFFSFLSSYSLFSSSFLFCILSSLLSQCSFCSFASKSFLLSPAKICSLASTRQSSLNSIFRNISILSPWSSCLSCILSKSVDIKYCNLLIQSLEAPVYY